jgi:hypothetical protein
VFLLQFAALAIFWRTSRCYRYGHACFDSKPRPPKDGGRLQVADRESVLGKSFYREVGDSW